MVNRDFPIKPVDAIVLHAHNKSLADELFFYTVRLVQGFQAKAVILNGSAGERPGSTVPGEAWAGFDVYVERLKECGLPDDVEIIRAGPGTHTLEEAEHFTQILVKHEYSAIVVSLAHHLPRVALTYMKVFCEIEYKPAIWWSAPDVFGWSNMYFGSLGLDVFVGMDLLSEELERIMTYYQNDWLEHPQKYFEYIIARNENEV